MSSQYRSERSEKDGENIGIIVKNKRMNGLEIKLECVIITFNHGFSVFNIFVCLFVLRLNVPVNNFSVMSGRSHRFLGN